MNNNLDLVVILKKKEKVTGWELFQINKLVNFITGARFAKQIRVKSVNLFES